MQYRLGNNQLKELLVRGTPLCICLPTPEEYPDDELAWARQALGEYGEFVVAADRIDICVTPSGDAGLTGILGAIVPEPFPDELTWWVDAIQCHLNPPKAIKIRHKRSRPQWPGYAINKAGKRWPKPADKEGLTPKSVIADEPHEQAQIEFAGNVPIVFLPDSAVMPKELEGD